MWLLNTNSLELEEFPEEQAPAYAILSHTWGEGEVTFSDMDAPASVRSTKPGYRKILYICEEARKRDISYAWVDTCCINKGSSAELSESINSMFRWYANAIVCFAYLADVPRVEFFSSRWFTRGWTLQELLAPPKLEFFSSEWVSLGTRQTQAREISKITGIGEAFLDPKSDTNPKSHHDAIRNLLMQASIAQRMSWAANRKTTRVEDMAYCLLGLFGINIPLLYGEGAEAFIRLQEAILQRVHDDQSIFAWKLDISAPNTSMHVLALATSPNAFSGCGSVVACRMDGYNPDLRFSNKGIQLNMPVSTDGEYIVLRCQSRDNPLEVLAIPVRFSAGSVCFRAHGDIKSAPHTACSQLRVTPIFFPIYPMQLRTSQQLQGVPRFMIKADSRYFALSGVIPHPEKLSTGVILPPDKVVRIPVWTQENSSFGATIHTAKFELKTSLESSAADFKGKLVCTIDALSMRSGSLENSPAIPLRLSCVLEEASQTASAGLDVGHVFTHGKVVYATSRAESVFGSITNVVELRVTSNPLNKVWFLAAGWATRLLGRRISWIPVGIYTYTITNLYASTGEMPLSLGIVYLWSSVSLLWSMHFSDNSASGTSSFIDLETAGRVVTRLLSSIHPGLLAFYARMIPVLAAMVSFYGSRSPHSPPKMLESAASFISVAISAATSPPYVTSLSQDERPLYIKMFPFGLFLFWLVREYRLGSRQAYWAAPAQHADILFFKGMFWLVGVSTLWCWVATELGWDKALHWSVWAIRVPLEVFLGFLFVSSIPSFAGLKSFLGVLLR